MEYKQLKEMLFQHESKNPNSHLTACVTFASFGPNVKTEYPWSSRTYIISSDNKAFRPGMGGYSIFGKCLDGTDPYLRLDRLMKDEHGGKDGWVVEDCGIAGYVLLESYDYKQKERISVQEQSSWTLIDLLRENCSVSVLLFSGVIYTVCVSKLNKLLPGIRRFFNEIAASIFGLFFIMHCRIFRVKLTNCV